MTPIRLALVDDHRVVTASLKAWFESFPDIRVVGIAASGEAALERAADWSPEVVLQDLLLPGGIDGITTIRRLRELLPAARVIALTASIDEPRMVAALRAGASGYLRKNAEPETLLTAVRAVAGGRTFIDPAVADRIAGAADLPVETLTPREMDVLRLLALGRPNREIADALGLSDETVKTHVSHLLAKLQVENRTKAIVEALKRGLVAIEEV